MARSALEPTIMDSKILDLEASKAKARELALQLQAINKKNSKKEQ
jgi:hypothetical protein